MSFLLSNWKELLKISCMPSVIIFLFNLVCVMFQGIFLKSKMRYPNLLILEG